MEKQLPKGWVETTIDQVTQIVSGGTPKTSVEEYFGGDIAWITPADLSKYKEKYIKKGRRNISLLGLEKSSARLLPKGTVLFSSRAPIGYVAIAGNDICTNQGFKNLIPNDYFDSSYAFYYLKHTKDYIESQASGTTFKEISGKKLGWVPFLLPPLAEQKRIVSKLDGLFGHLEVLQERLSRIPELLKDFRQSVLTQAVTGKLTEAWREGKELEAWEVKSISQITSKVGSGSTPKGGQAAYKEAGIPLIRSMNVHFRGIKYKGLAFIDDVQSEKLKNATVKANDVLLNITGASIGRVCLAPKKLDGARVNQHVSIIRVIDGVLPIFLNIYMSSSKVQDYINSENYGVTRQALTKTQLLDLIIRVPDVKEQAQIVKTVENLFTKADVIQARYAQVKAQIDTLPQAILAKAFRGELVEQLPTDGDAQALLEEIVALREELAKGKKGKLKKK